MTRLTVAAVLVLAIVRAPSVSADDLPDTRIPSPASVARARVHASLVRTLATSSDAGARRRAAVRLGRRGDVNAVRPLLDALATDGSHRVRLAVVRGLADIGGTEACDALWFAWTTDDSRAVRRSALRALGSCPPHASVSDTHWIPVGPPAVEPGDARLDSMLLLIDTGATD